MRNVTWNVAAAAAAAGDDGRLLISAARNGFSFGPLCRPVVVVVLARLIFSVQQQQQLLLPAAQAAARPACPLGFNLSKQHKKPAQKEGKERRSRERGE